MAVNGVNTFIEVGTGTVLGGLIKRITDGVTIMPLGKSAGFFGAGIKRRNVVATSVAFTRTIEVAITYTGYESILNIRKQIMPRKLSLITIIFLLTACAPMDFPLTDYPTAVTQIPFYVSDTPEPFIVPVTDTPIVIPVVTPIAPPVIDTPVVVPTAKWWDVYFTDPLTISNPDVIDNSIDEKLIQLINSAQTSIHIASFEFNVTSIAEALIAAKNRGVDVKWATDSKHGLEYDTLPRAWTICLF